MSTPAQYLQVTPTKEKANLSPLQIAASYYMDEGQQTPFFINHELLRQLTVFSSSAQLTPEQVGLDGLSFIQRDGNVYLFREAPECGPDGGARYEDILVGTVEEIAPESWSFDSITVRGGSAADGGGGPWGTGGLSSQDPTPNNGVDRSPDIVPNIRTAYSSTIQTNGIG
jgi:hypothetical protein